MINNLKTIFVVAIASCLLTSCSAWIEFDIKRYAFSFFITLIIGVVGMIVMAISGGNRNNKR